MEGVRSFAFALRIRGSATMMRTARTTIHELQRGAMRWRKRSNSLRVVPYIFHQYGLPNKGSGNGSNNVYRNVPPKNIKCGISIDVVSVVSNHIQT